MYELTHFFLYCKYQSGIKNIQQKGGRCITTVSYLPENIDKKQLLRIFKKKFNCGGCITNIGGNNIIQMQGDQRHNISLFLVNNEICDKTNIRVCGV